MKRMMALLALLKAKAIPTTTVIAVILGMQYVMADVDAKHKTAMDQIRAQKTQVIMIQRNQAVVLNTLKNINKSLDEVKGSVQNTNQKVWQISRDIKKGK